MFSNINYLWVNLNFYWIKISNPLGAVLKKKQKEMIVAFVSIVSYFIAYMILQSTNYYITVSTISIFIYIATSDL